MRQLLITMFLFGLGALSGCADRPEISFDQYGTIVDQLPTLQKAEEPFKFPHGGDNDHQSCEFKDDDMF